MDARLYRVPLEEGITVGELQLANKLTSSEEYEIHSHDRIDDSGINKNSIRRLVNMGIIKRQTVTSNLDNTTEPFATYFVLTSFGQAVLEKYPFVSYTCYSPVSEMDLYHAWINEPNVALVDHEIRLLKKLLKISPGWNMFIFSKRLYAQKGDTKNELIYATADFIIKFYFITINKLVNERIANNHTNYDEFFSMKQQSGFHIKRLPADIEIRPTLVLDPETEGTRLALSAKNLDKSPRNIFDEAWSAVLEFEDPRTSNYQVTYDGPIEAMKEELWYLLGKYLEPANSNRKDNF